VIELCLLGAGACGKDGLAVVWYLVAALSTVAVAQPQLCGRRCSLQPNVHPCVLGRTVTGHFFFRTLGSLAMSTNIDKCDTHPFYAPLVLPVHQPPLHKSGLLIVLSPVL
jgi:hypothetical protein